MLIAVLAMVSATSMTATLTDLRIAGAYYKSVAVFHIAEAGLVHGRHEVSDEDGDRDFSDVSAPTTLFDAREFHGGSYTVVATAHDRRYAGQAPAPFLRVLSRRQPLSALPCESRPRNPAGA